MKTMVMILGVGMLLSGCAFTNQFISRAGDKAAEEFDEACETTPDHLKVSGGMAINGKLMQRGGAILTCCPDDHRPICKDVKSYYEELFEMARGERN